MKPITGAVLAGLMRVWSDTREHGQRALSSRSERGLDVREVRHDREGDYHTLVRGDGRRPRRASARRRHPVRQCARRAWSRSSASGSRPSSTGQMIYIVNEDAPGFIGRARHACSARPASTSAPSTSAAAPRAARRWLGVGRQRDRAGAGGEARRAGRRQAREAAALLGEAGNTVRPEPVEGHVLPLLLKRRREGFDKLSPNGLQLLLGRKKKAGGVAGAKCLRHFADRAGSTIGLRSPPASSLLG